MNDDTRPPTDGARLRACLIACGVIVPRDDAAALRALPEIEAAIDAKGYLALVPREPWQRITVP